MSLGFVVVLSKPVYQLSRGFVGAEGSRVKVLPKDVEGDATFGPRLINLTQLSSSSQSPLMPSEARGWDLSHRACVLSRKCVLTKSGRVLEEDGDTE